MRTRGLRAAVGALVVLAALVACSGTPDPTPTPTPTPAESKTPSVTPTPEPTLPEYVSTIAYVDGQQITVYDAPGGEVQMVLDAADVLTVPEQTPLVLLAKTVQADAIEVFLPVRPNGTTGWVNPDDVSLYTTDFQLDVFHEDHTMTLSKAGEEVATFPIATGQDGLPTPGGTYFLRELLSPPDPNGSYGPYAYGLSGYSPVLDDFNGGDAVIGIHGTNDRSSIGKDISHGCIRMYNEDITELVETWKLPLGTPVYIHE